MNEEQIALYMRNLNISREEAIQLIKDEEEDNLPELTEEQKKVEKKMLRAERKKETKPRNRIHKDDPDKLALIAAVTAALTPICENIVTINPERSVDFEYNGNKYGVTLIKHRKEKN